MFKNNDFSQVQRPWKFFSRQNEQSKRMGIIFAPLFCDLEVAHMAKEPVPEWCLKCHWFLTGLNCCHGARCTCAASAKNIPAKTGRLSALL